MKRRLALRAASSRRGDTTATRPPYRERQHHAQVPAGWASHFVQNGCKKCSRHLVPHHRPQRPLSGHAPGEKHTRLHNYFNQFGDDDSATAARWFSFIHEYHHCCKPHPNRVFFCDTPCSGLQTLSRWRAASPVRRPKAAVPTLSAQWPLADTTTAEPSLLPLPGTKTAALPDDISGRDTGPSGSKRTRLHSTGRLSRT